MSREVICNELIESSRLDLITVKQCVMCALTILPFTPPINPVLAINHCCHKKTKGRMLLRVKIKGKQI